MLVMPLPKITIFNVDGLMHFDAIKHQYIRNGRLGCCPFCINIQKRNSKSCMSSYLSRDLDEFSMK